MNDLQSPPVKEASETEPVKVETSRPVTVTAVQLWSTRQHTADENRGHALDMARRAAQPVDAPPPDLVVMPEAIAMLCYPDGRPDFTYHDVADSIPGPTSDAFCAIASEANTNLVVGLIEERGNGVPCQNVTLVIDRSGSITGRYEKVHEPEVCRVEQAAGTGEEVPTFDLDFGRIGIMVCWDLISPELASILSLKGAELICMPHLVGLPTVGNFAVTLRARAIDGGVYVVAAGMRDPHNHNGTQDGLGATCIVDPRGNVVAQTECAGEDTITAVVNLSAADPNRRRVLEARGDRRVDVYAREYANLSR